MRVAAIRSTLMKSPIRTLCLGLATLVLSQAAFAGQKKIVDVSDILNRSVKSDKEDAVILVKAAEDLLIPGGVSYADELMNVALLIDPSNIKAQFYRRLLAP